MVPVCVVCVSLKICLCCWGLSRTAVNDFWWAGRLYAQGQVDRVPSCVYGGMDVYLIRFGASLILLEVHT
jgi:hypothetical protein